MTEQIKRVVTLGKPLSVIKGLITKELLRLDKVKFEADIKAEYELRFPTKRDLTFEEYMSDPDVDEYGIDIPYSKADIYNKKYIDYSQDENYVTFEEYKNETKVIQEAVYYTYDEFINDERNIGLEVSEEDYIPVIKTPEVTELVRPYTPIEVTDEMIQAELDKLGYVPKEKREAQKYLNDTDWYVVRYAEQGVEMPQEVLDKRQECREIL
jgi:hypothetical protein